MVFQAYCIRGARGCIITTVFIRYRRDGNGNPVPHAYVYTEKEHGIDRSKIDPDAARIIERLKSAGQQAYIVGGAVRDLLKGKLPKDFDLVTDALPARIRKLFRNARIIGKRFKLVHIYSGDKIFELSTFRSNRNGSIGNEFGTMDEDVLRRDFTINALYYDPTDGNLVDFVGGYKDILAGKLKPIIPLSRIFAEDPVRIVRGVKYATAGNFKFSLALRMAIRRDAKLLADVSHSRLTEEFFKILASGRSESIVKALCDFRLFGYFVPAAWARMQSDLSYSRALFEDLKTLDVLRLEVSDAEISDSDEEAASQGKRKISVLLSHFLKSVFDPSVLGAEYSDETYRNALAEARVFMQPLNPPRVELEAAILMIFRSLEISPLQKPPKSRRRRRPAP